MVGAPSDGALAAVPSLTLSDREALLPAVLQALDRLFVEIRRAPTLEALRKLRHEAISIQARWRPVKEIADRAGDCWIEAEYKLGDELDKVPKAKGTRGNFRGVKEGGSRGRHGVSTGGAKVAPPVEAPTDDDKGVRSKRLAARVRKIRALGESECERLRSKLKDQDKPVTPNGLLAEHRAENKTEKKHAVATAAFSEDGPFDVVVIDPPWDMQKIDREVRPNQDAFDYPTMSIEQLIEFWRGEIAPRLNPDVHVFMWTTQRFLPHAINLLGLVDLRYVLTMVWHKPGGFQPIDLPQYNCEFAVYARRGKPLFVDTKDFPCCFEAERREHSRKPDEFYDTIRRVTGGSRIDVFSREAREGFAQFGNEMSKFAEVA